jgi:hypothetical protein
MKQCNADAVQTQYNGIRDDKCTTVVPMVGAALNDAGQGDIKRP